VPAARSVGGGHACLQPGLCAVPDQDDDMRGVAALAIVPVDAGDPTVPVSCAALRELGGRSLLHWAMTTLTASGVVRRVVIVAPPALEPAARDVVAAVSGDAIEVLPVPADGPANRVLAGLRPAGDEIVVVHDPLHPLSTPALARAVVHELVAAPRAVAAVPVRPVTDTLKWVDADEVVLDTADRERYRLVGSPQAYRREPLLEVLAGADEVDLRAEGAEVLPRLVAARGGRIAFVPLPGEVFRVATEDDLVLAGALLAADADLRRDIGLTTHG
jgi:2-C-methyl-D-erythritol 4-phosphate cytidylyltransferase